MASPRRSPQPEFRENKAQQAYVEKARQLLFPSTQLKTDMRSSGPWKPGLSSSSPNVDELSAEIFSYCLENHQSEQVFRKKLAMRDALYLLLRQHEQFAVCGLYVVGSSMNGFGRKDSDMDLCLMITEREICQRTDAMNILGQVQSMLSHVSDFNAFMQSAAAHVGVDLASFIPVLIVREMSLIPAKVPILRVRFSGAFEDITVDLNANNSVAIRNTHLLFFYAQWDHRVRALVLIVKEWAQRADINDAQRSTLSSYSLVLMVIHYLQGTSPPVVPVLQKEFFEKFNPAKDVRSLNIMQPLQDTEEGREKNTESLGELFLGFLDYYANKFDFDQEVISIREGKKLTRSEIFKSTHTGHSLSQWRYICIEEPFTLTNASHSVYDETAFNKVKMSFKSSFSALSKSRSLAGLFGRQWQVPPHPPPPPPPPPPLPSPSPTAPASPPRSSPDGKEAGAVQGRSQFRPPLSEKKVQFPPLMEQEQEPGRPERPRPNCWQRVDIAKLFGRENTPPPKTPAIYPPSTERRAARGGSGEEEAYNVSKDSGLGCDSASSREHIPATSHPGLR